MLASAAEDGLPLVWAAPGMWRPRHIPPRRGGAAHIVIAVDKLKCKTTADWNKLNAYACFKLKLNSKATAYMA